MIRKEREIPIRIRKIQSSLDRVIMPSEKRAILEGELKSRLAGYYGEKAIDYYLRKLPENENYILHSLRLQMKSDYFQIDTLLLTDKYALIIEVKNLAGELFFDVNSKQLIQTTADGEVKGYQNPVQQAMYQKRDLEKVFQSKAIHLPIEYLVILSKPSTILKTNSKYAIPKMIHAQYLIEEIEHLNKKYHIVIHEQKAVKKMAKMLAKLHCPETYDVLKANQFTQEDIQKGVRCTDCGHTPMQRKHGTWICPNCCKIDIHAHVKAVEDYFLLFESPLTNQKFRDFTFLDSEQTANRLLKKMDLPHSGNGRCRMYYRLN
ncbi:nuclease-related domain-containing protein [Cytobacillus gottheilii]|uniref:nuclease-related domain-containing protein n=1 Tax=Cytobacillus gottheilii TaxID=859144 RepID=UPI0009BB2668|nr:nuclease-related domain-containing protein [Cytobacillus gottheilii]